MPKPPEDMSTVWVRDENGDIRKRIKEAARKDGRKSADYLRMIIEAALAEDEPPYIVKCGAKNAQNG